MKKEIKVPLYNKVDGRLLKQQIEQSNEERKTISFYRYFNIINPQEFRDQLFIDFSNLGVLGRIYLAKEGINAQISLPTQALENFKFYLDQTKDLANLRLNVAVEDDGKSFFKLAIKVRDKIVADGITDPSFDPSNMGTHLSAAEFNQLTSQPTTLLVDMRNHYESEVGHFKGAILPDSDTFREELPLVVDLLKDKKDQHIVMYCTGGIRCEKASAYLKHQGFENVYQLEGGIIKYAKDAKEQGLENKFIGKNFVFDDRLGERISEDVIAECHQCGSPCDDHINCANDACHLLFIQCPTCAEKYHKCCSVACYNFSLLPEEEKANYRKGVDLGRQVFKKGRLRPKLGEAFIKQTLKLDPAVLTTKDEQ
jgi:UPF0176 protein